MHIHTCRFKTFGQDTSDGRCGRGCSPELLCRHGLRIQEGRWDILCSRHSSPPCRTDGGSQKISF